MDDKNNDENKTKKYYKYAAIGVLVLIIISVIIILIVHHFTSKSDDNKKKTTPLTDLVAPGNNPPPNASVPIQPASGTTAALLIQAPNSANTTCTPTDKAALINGYMEGTQRQSPCDAYPYSNNLIVNYNSSASGNIPILYEYPMSKQNTCCYFLSDPTSLTIYSTPNILIKASDNYPIPGSILNEPPYSFDPETKEITYLLPNCDTTNNNACIAFIKTSDTSGLPNGAYAKYVVYRLNNITIDPSTTYPPPPSGANPDTPNPFTLNTLNVQILKDTVFTIQNIAIQNPWTRNYMFRGMSYKNNVLISCPPTDTDYETCTRMDVTSYPLLVQVLAKLVFGSGLAPIPGYNPPMQKFMSSTT